jgi:hypothetical protein|tara:strand:+ start:1885 stop:2613 length:729 start_codon:yes stop_codon:yes gene_type:complete
MSKKPTPKNPTGVPYVYYNWGPCLIRIKISEAFQQKLLKEAYASRKESLSMNKRLAGIIKEEYAFRNRDVFLPEFLDIFNLYWNAYNQYKRSTEKRKAPKYLLRSLWCNFQGPNEFNPPHDHDGALSFVIYLQIPDKLKKENKAYIGKSAGPGGIQFLYGAGSDRSYISYQSHFPEDRDMFIFPASLAHYVAPFTSDCTRISVSGNIHDSAPINTLPADTKFEPYHPEEETDYPDLKKARKK